MKTKLPKLIVAASESCADLLFATGFFAPDAFAFLQSGGKRRILVNDLEIDRARRQARVDAVDSLSEVAAKFAARSRKGLPSYNQSVLAWLKGHRVRSVLVPSDFPLGLADELRRAGLRVEPVKGHFWPEREFKTAAELRLITQALRLTEQGMERAMQVLKASGIARDGKLTYGGSVLTSERLRAEIDTVILQGGGLARDTIVAGGNQACDPHERGHGALKAHQLIIIDIFPRHVKSGYFGDLTRTVVRGRASEAHRHLWHTCLEGQARGLRAMKPGQAGGPIHEAIGNFFADEGYPTRIHRGRWQGFFHGTGHGLGLEIHEEPRFSQTIFKPGQVFTVEPGIYVHGLGGVRHEDVVTITSKKARLLTRAPKPLEL